MRALSEQVGFGKAQAYKNRRKVKRSIKRAKVETRRLFRRLGKWLGEEAPRKHFYKGYWD